MKATTYTAEQTTLAIAEYQAGTAVELIAQLLGKTTKSVIAKLAREKVYTSTASAKTVRVTKADLVAQIAASTGLTPESAESLTHATATVLATIAQCLSEIKQVKSLAELHCAD